MSLAGLEKFHPDATDEPGGDGACEWLPKPEELAEKMTNDEWTPLDRALGIDRWE